MNGGRAGSDPILRPPFTCEWLGGCEVENYHISILERIVVWCQTAHKNTQYGKQLFGHWEDYSIWLEWDHQHSDWRLFSAANLLSPLLNCLRADLAWWWRGRCMRDVWEEKINCKLWTESLTWKVGHHHPSAVGLLRDDRLLCNC